MKFELLLISIHLIYSIYLLMLSALSVMADESLLTHQLILLAFIIFPLTLILLALGLIALGFQKRRVASFIIGIAGLISLPLGTLSLSSACFINKYDKTKKGMTFFQAIITVVFTVLMMFYFTYR